MQSAFDKPVFSLSGINKQFSGVHALKNVDLEIYTAEVLALIGENGAGKSTLMKVLGGIYQPDSGRIQYCGNDITIPDVKRSNELGVAFIHQELSLLENLDIASNMFLGRESVQARCSWMIDRKRLYEKAEPYLSNLGLKLSPKTPVSELSIAQRQIVEIAKALSLNACVMIMDEPTSSLTMSETCILFDIIEQLKNSGVSIVYISHRLNEIMTCADRVAGLRDGANSGGLSRSQITHENMVKMMVGRDIKPAYHEPAKRSKEAKFKVCRVKTSARPDKELSFEVHEGEIYGITGLVGAGRTELAETIFGARTCAGGTVSLRGKELKIRSVSDAVKNGIYLIPEDRRACGLIMDMSVMENLTLPDLIRHSRFGLLSRKLEVKAAKRRCEESNIKAADIRIDSKNLSGGNQQKIVISKWLFYEPRVVILDEPTRGIDIGSKTEIYKTLRELAGKGIIVIVISSDMEEVMSVCDRVMVMCEGQITGTLDRVDCSEESLMNLAVGSAEAGTDVKNDGRQLLAAL